MYDFLYQLSVAVERQHLECAYSGIVQNVDPAFGCAFTSACIPCRTVSTRDIACNLDSHRIGRYGQVAVRHEPDDPGLCRETVQHGIRQHPSVLISVQVDYLNAAPAISPGASAEQCCCGDEQCGGW